MAPLHHSATDLADRRFGRLVAIAPSPERSRKGDLQWDCRCDCGHATRVVGAYLLAGDVASCGCLRRERGAWRRMRAFRSWRSMRERCCRPTDANYANYGGRGITVCERWRSFENFLADMGERPEGTTLDRIDNDGNYEPGNCRWATPAMQRNNSRQARVLQVGDERLPMIEWSRRSGVPASTIRKRLTLGWSASDAVRGRAR